MTPAPADRSNWGDLSLDDLVAEVAYYGAAVAECHEQLALDLMSYHREFWSAWGGTDPSKSVAARNRDTERQITPHALFVMQRRGTLNSLVTALDTVRTILEARLGKANLHGASSLADTYPPDVGLELDRS